MVALAAIYNGLMAHGGATVLFTLPARWPLVGGPITLESLVYGALTGAALALLLVSFTTLRRALTARDLVRLVPRAVGPLALVLAVALTFAPATLDQLAALREAQALRGLAPRGPRAWARLAVPLVVGGLERALALAESMTARGLAPAAAPPTPAARLGLLAGVGALLSGWLAPAVGVLAWPAGLSLCAVGVILVAGTLRALARRLPHTDYRRAPWRAGDSLVALAAWATVALGLATPAGRAALAWLPYPALSWPPLPVGLALSLAGLALPAWLLARAAAGAGAGAGTES
jgi:energy-coupling factor transport system permease protein